MNSKYSPSSNSHSILNKKNGFKQGESMLTFYEVICLEGKEKQGESDVPREGRKLGQVNKTPGLLFGYFI